MLHSTPIQAARGAMLIWQCLQYRRLIERQELEPVLRKTCFCIEIDDLYMYLCYLDQSSRIGSSVFLAV